jgi:hypothetical protein
MDELNLNKEVTTTLLMVEKVCLHYYELNILAIRI